MITKKARPRPGFLYLTIVSCLGFYFRHFLLLVHIGEEDWEGNKEGDTDQIFNSLDVGVVINQGVERSDHADGYHVLPYQLAY